MRKLLWVGDAAVATGFAKCTHAALDVLRHTWDVRVIGINHRGDPDHGYPYHIFPAARGYSADDAFGVVRFAAMVKEWQPDAAVLLQDPWNVHAYMKSAGDVPVVGWIAVDGKNCRGAELNALAHVVFWTRFAAEQAQLGGYTGTFSVVPLGVDLDTFKPVDRSYARGPQGVGLPDECQDWFVVGSVGRNQVRKRLDLTIAYFAEWIKTRRIPDAMLFLHVAPTGDDAFNLKQLVAYYGLQNHVMLVAPHNGAQGLPESHMSLIYSCFDVQLSTTQGEGWGLCVQEGMACGVPQIVPDWSALGEWTEDAAVKVPCTSIAHSERTLNVVGGVPDMRWTIGALDTAYRNRAHREALARKGTALVSRPEFRWENVGLAFRDALEAAVAPRAAAEVA